MRGEELHRLVDVHRQHFADRLAAQPHLQRLGVEARAAARLAQDAHVGQEGHLDLLHALAFATLAAPAGGVEREAARAPAAHAGLGRVGEQLADLVPEADVGGGAGARRLADRRLVDLQHALDALVVPDRLAADVAFFYERSKQHVAGKRGLARPGNAGHRHQAAEREAGVDALQVVQARLLDLDEGILAVHRAARLQRMLQGVLQEAAGNGFRVARQLLGVAFGDHLAAELAGAGAEVEHVVGAADGVLVVLDHYQRVALRLELLQHVEQDLVVAVVQADRRLVEDVAHAAQVGAELRRQADALRLAAGQGRRRAVQGQVAEADLLEEAEARLQLGDDVAGNFRFPSVRLDPGEQIAQAVDRLPRVLRNAPVAPAHRQRLGVEAGAVAGFAGLVDLEPLDPRVEHIVLGAGARALVGPVDLVDVEAGAVALRAPAVLGVVGEQARIELGETT